MAVATFDTLKFANTLKAAGVPDKQAEAQAMAFAEVVQANFKELVTKDDLQQAVKEIRQELRREVNDLRQEMKGGDESIRQELQQTTKDLRSEIQSGDESIRQELQQTTKDLRLEIRQIRDELKQEMREESIRVNAKIDNLYAKLVGEMTLLKWMFGLNVTLMAGILIRLFFFRVP